MNVLQTIRLTFVAALLSALLAGVSFASIMTVDDFAAKSQLPSKATSDWSDGQSSMSETNPSAPPSAPSIKRDGNDIRSCTMRGKLPLSPNGSLTVASVLIQVACAETGDSRSGKLYIIEFLRFPSPPTRELLKIPIGR